MTKAQITEHEAGQIVFGRYLLERPLGRGGMGTVWAATDRKLRREVAVKLLAPDYASSEGAIARFEREAMLVARIQSPHIVQIFDYGVDYRSPFMVMELLAGEDLRARLRRVGRVSLREIAKIVAQVSLGLAEAHAVGLVHRDLKPGNVFLARSRTGEITKVLDFGVAKPVGENAPVDQDELTKRGSMVGTPHYMSPEQIRTLPDVDYRSDLWGVGVIAYRALTGELPFSGQSANDLSVNICTGIFTPPSQHVPELGREVDEFMTVALARAPGDRFGSARELAEALLRIATPSHAGIDVDDAVVAATLSGSTEQPFGSGSYAPFDSSPSGRGSHPQPAYDSEALPPTRVALASNSGTLLGTSLEGSGTAPPRSPWPRRALLLGGAAILLAGGIALGSSLSGEPERPATRDTHSAAATVAAARAPAPAASSAPPASVSASATPRAAASARPVRPPVAKPGGKAPPPVDIFKSRR